MLGNSHEYPERFVSTGGRIQFRYAIVETSRRDPDGAETTSYDYEYVEAPSLSRNVLIDALISAVYSRDVELALINNELATPGTTEYAEYQAYRASVKQVVDEALGPEAVATAKIAEVSLRQVQVERLAAGMAREVGEIALKG